ncbi:hypothetical protein AAW12_23110 [Sphingobacterium sp. Ag1]|uniref:DUF5977 domain-containing protein n=1 Tax=Sphingobacterium sp. Ag1 TaxID=1643451 RepID=UPI000637AC8C|nr:DUF5977 domain-containing protein [Sphingobacterium sp. Ag1]KKO89054.1 hypothetical protein AAW12_23110 [Sphingobacterium sp. Ag1]
MKKIHAGGSQQNGTNQVSINLMTIKIDNSIELPIDLTYTGGGVKYGSTSGDVGIDWSLSTNFRIVRTIYGRPDEHYVRPSGTQIDSYVNETNKLLRDQKLTQFTEGLVTNGGLPLTSGYSLMDSEYDIFDYSIPGAQGSFIVDNFAQNKIFTPHSELFKFNFQVDAQDGVSRIDMYDSKGNLFTCGVDPETGVQLQEKLLSSYYQGKGGANGWPLTKITTPGNNWAKFKYVLRNVNESNPGQRSLVINETPDQGYPAIPRQTILNEVSSESGGFKSTNFIDSILCQDGFIKFYRRANANLVDSICMYDLAKKRVKKVIFYQSAESGFIFLDSIRISGKNDSEMIKYRFDYNGHGNTNNYRTKPNFWGDLMFTDQLNSNVPIPNESGNDIFYTIDPSQPGYNLKNLRNESLFMNLSGNRSLDGSASNIFCLSRVFLPTGGYKSFFYEPNEFFDGTSTVTGPGVRLKSIEDYNNNGMMSERTTYTYAEGDIPVKIDAGMFCEDKVALYLDVRQPSYYCGRVRLYSSDVIFDNDPFFSKYNVVSYAKVTESNGNGSTISYFKKRTPIQWNQGFGINNSFFSRILNGTMSREHPTGFISSYNLWDQSILVQKEIKDNTGNLLRNEQYNYETINQQNLKGIKIRPFATFADAYTPVPNLYANIESVYDFRAYDLNIGTQVLKQTIITEYRGGIPLTSNELYTYNEKKQLATSTSVGSNQDKHITKFIYPSFYTGLTGTDVITQDVLKMQQRNILEDYLLKTEHIAKFAENYTKEYTVGAEFKTIFPGSNNVRSLYRFNAVDPVLNFVPVTKTGGSLVLGGGFTKEEELLKIDNNGNPLFKITKNQAGEAFIWGYRRRYPVAHIIGLGAYDDLKLKYNIDTAKFNPTLLSENTIAAELINLRGKLAGKGVSVSTFTHFPLIGVSSVTGPTGEDVSYEYDALHRLSATKRADGNYIKTYAYNAQTNNKKLFRNVLKTQNFTKTGCPVNMVPQQMSYVVPNGVYFSAVSQADADAMAAQDIAANGQQYANTHGVCYYTNTMQSKTFIKNNCDFGKTGSAVVYQVAAGKYLSVKSVAEANQFALNEIAEKGQNHANGTGTCGNYTAPVYYNNYLSRDIAKNNCSSGLVGSTEKYSVAGGKYSSTISQLDADNKALTEVNTTGQTYANNIGECMAKVSFYKNSYPGNVVSITFFTPKKNYTFTANANGEIGTLGIMYVPLGECRIEVVMTGPTESGNFYMSYRGGTANLCEPLYNGYATRDNLVITSGYNSIVISDSCE